MYNKKIDNYSFELETETSRIMVYQEGQGVEPVAYINVKPNISEKEFDYEIMWWTSQKK